MSLEDAAQALLDDVRRRYPGEELRCQYMRDLEAALSRREAGEAVPYIWVREYSGHFDPQHGGEPPSVEFLDKPERGAFPLYTTPPDSDAIHNAAVEIVGRYDAHDQSKRPDGEDVNVEMVVMQIKAAHDAVKLLRTLIRPEKESTQ